MALPGMIDGGASAQDALKLLRFDFHVQFCWQPQTPTEREAARRALKQAEAEAAETAGY